ncbi:MAG TPA: hypothetical protein VEZ42_15055 [Pseudonocardia sp.]|jgi:hypothetical protein|nr:hypothetical protein [Pseudonocardia sp.]
MFGRSRRRAERERADAARAMFIANREQVRSWLAGWDFPEVSWPPVPSVPSSWAVLEGQEQAWLERHAPFLSEYWWLLEATPTTSGITSVHCSWWFGQEHRFERLEIRTRTAADPPYLAEKLALGVHAAALRGWSEGDVQDVHGWLLELIDERPMSLGVRAKNRLGHVLAEATRFPHSRTEIDMHLVVTETDTALDGSPLSGSGRTVP